MLRVGLNPYGLAYSIGLQGRGTARANPAPMTMAEFIALADRLARRASSSMGGGSPISAMRILRDARHH